MQPYTWFKYQPEIKTFISEADGIEIWAFMFYQCGQDKEGVGGWVGVCVYVWPRGEVDQTRQMWGMWFTWGKGGGLYGGVIGPMVRSSVSSKMFGICLLPCGACWYNWRPNKVRFGHYSSFSPPFFIGSARRKLTCTICNRKCSSSLNLQEHRKVRLCNIFCTAQMIPTRYFAFVRIYLA